MEEWRDVIGYEGLYQVSNKGNVKNLNWRAIGRERLLSPLENVDGYWTVDLYKNGECRRKRVHRLVAEAFIDNPNGLPVINHKDENKHNNAVENLEWCSVRYNTIYGKSLNNMLDSRTTRGSSNRRRKVVGTSLKDGSVIEFDSVSDANRFFTGISMGANVGACARGLRKSCYGYVWNYA